jgi:hypothetical protein
LLSTINWAIIALNGALHALDPAVSLIRSGA